MAHEECNLAHWHPGGQIWDDEPLSTCWLWKFGAEPCDWDGDEGIEAHPGAKMIRDRVI